jgi:hypothetical protein
MKKQESFRILCNGRVLYQYLSQEEMFKIMDELSQQYYETGVPNPDDLMVECVGDFQGDE